MSRFGSDQEDSSGNESIESGDSERQFHATPNNNIENEKISRKGKELKDKIMEDIDMFEDNNNDNDGEHKSKKLGKKRKLHIDEIEGWEFDSKNINPIITVISTAAAVTMSNNNDEER